jgi:hypothetical protein
MSPTGLKSFMKTFLTHSIGSQLSISSTAKRRNVQLVKLAGLTSVTTARECASSACTAERFTIK